MGKIFIFDLDGTLLLRKNKDWKKQQLIDWLKFNRFSNPSQLITNKAWAKREERIKFLGLTKADYIKMYENFSKTEFETNKRELLKGNIFLAPYTIPLLKKINAPKILLSGACSDWVEYSSKHFGIKTYFDYIYKRDYKFGKPTKPDPSILWDIENKFQTISKNSFVIGDSKDDSDLAHNFGLKSIGVYNMHKFDFNFRSIKQFYLNINKFTF